MARFSEAGLPRHSTERPGFALSMRAGCVACRVAASLTLTRREAALSDHRNSAPPPWVFLTLRPWRAGWQEDPEDPNHPDDPEGPTQRSGMTVCKTPSCKAGLVAVDGLRQLKVAIQSAVYFPISSGESSWR
jgi:hypothetical protein